MVCMVRRPGKVPRRHCKAYFSVAPVAVWRRRSAVYGVKEGSILFGRASCTTGCGPAAKPPPLEGGDRECKSRHPDHFRVSASAWPSGEGARVGLEIVGSCPTALTSFANNGVWASG
jgi:hypothetical protein